MGNEALNDMPLCADCPITGLRTRLETAARRTNALDQGLYKVAGELLTATACQGPRERKTQYSGSVLDCGNAGYTTAMNLTEQILEITNRFQLDSRLGTKATS